MAVWSMAQSRWTDSVHMTIGKTGGIRQTTMWYVSPSCSRSYQWRRLSNCPSSRKLTSSNECVDRRSDPVVAWKRLSQGHSWNGGCYIQDKGWKSEYGIHALYVCQWGGYCWGSLMSRFVFVHLKLWKSDRDAWRLKEGEQTLKKMMDEIGSLTSENFGGEKELMLRAGKKCAGVVEL